MLIKLLPDQAVVCCSTPILSSSWMLQNHYITYGNVTSFSSKCFSLHMKVE